VHQAQAHQAFLRCIEEGSAASKSPHQKFGYFLSIFQQAVSADITKNWAVEYSNHEY
jgi:hypothetical protein